MLPHLAYLFTVVAALSLLGGLVIMIGNSAIDERTNYADSQANLCQYEQGCDVSAARAHADTLRAEHHAYVDREMRHALLWSLLALASASISVTLALIHHTRVKQGLSIPLKAA